MPWTNLPNSSNGVDALDFLEKAGALNVQLAEVREALGPIAQAKVKKANLVLESIVLDLHRRIEALESAQRKH